MIPVNLRKEAVITGLGVINSVANTVSDFRKALYEGVSGIYPIKSFSTDGLRNPQACEAIAFNQDAITQSRSERCMDRSSALVLAAFDEALAMSGLDPATVAPKRGAVISGTTIGGSGTGLSYYRELRNGHRRPARLRDGLLYSPGYRLCIETGFLGPNILLSTACTSSNFALASALDLIRTGRAEVVLVCGYDPMSELTCAGFSVLRNVTPTLCRPFDKRRDGLILGEGAAVLIMEEETFRV